jgi:NADP-dependent 3-hydroxy acid dehydrogenase YdfG
MDRTAMNKLSNLEMDQKNITRTQLDESRLLYGKVAAIFGVGGAIGSQVAREFSKEGATVFLSGKHLSSVESVVKEIRTSGTLLFRRQEGEKQ